MTYYIENISKAKVLGTTSNGEVSLQNRTGEAGQLWKKEKAKTDGYYIFENSNATKVLTAIDEHSFEINGNITLICPKLF